MKTRVLTTGLWAGLLASLAALYPALSLVAPLSIDGLLRPIESELIHGIALMASAAAAGIIFFTFGMIAARRGGATSWRTGAKMGALAGLIVGAMTFLLVLSPLSALFAYAELLPYQPSAEWPLPPVGAINQYTSLMLYSPNEWLFYTLLLNAFIGGVGGLLTGLRNPSPVDERPPLDQFVKDNPKKAYRWLNGDEQTYGAAVLIGLAVGILVMFMELNSLANVANFAMTLPQNILPDGTINYDAPQTFTFIPRLALLLTGGLVVYFAQNPNTRWHSRIKATILATNIVMLPVGLIVLRYIYLITGLLPFLTYNAVTAGQAKTLQVASEVAPELSAAQTQELILWVQEIVVNQTLKTYFFGTTAFILPWAAILWVVLTMTLLGCAQGVFFTWLITMFKPAPVDKAVRLFRQIRRKPKEVLPQVYSLFNKHHDAYDILSHVAACSSPRSTAVARLTAGLHTLGTSDSPPDQLRATEDLQYLLKENNDWRWSTNMSNIFHSLHTIQNAWTLEDILKIERPSDLTTGSLPQSVVASVQFMSRIIDELNKVEKVEDLRTKVIFLENTLKAIHDAQQMMAEQEEEVCAVAKPPEHLALSTSLTHWQNIIVELIQRVKGRAAITCTLKNETAPLSAHVPLVYEIENSGLNVAQHVRLRVQEGEGYHLAENGYSDILIDILPPGEKQEISTTIVPTNGQRRLRVAWDITYDDAIDDARLVEFADVIEFTDPDKPFERIFPIPYVTGTPLKSDDVFVGREDVFSFIRENLLGTHQNNAVILHGQRRTGKTSVLYRLGRVMQDTHIGVLIDMQGKPARGEAEFLYSIADDIVFTLEEHDIFVDMPEREDFEEAPEFFFRNRFLRGLHKELGEKNLLLLFDEFEELQQRVENGRLSPDIFTFLRNLMQHEAKVDFVFSGTHKLEQLGAEYWSVLFNIAVYKPITFLSSNEIRNLILEPVKDESIEYDPLAIKRISQVAAGHPYFTQLILHEMITYYNETERTYITPTDVDTVLSRIVERGEAHFKYIWAESSEEEQLILRAFTELLVSADAVNIKDLKKFLAERGYQWNEAWDEALLSIQSRDIITSRTAKSALYRFKVDLIRLWIDHTRPSL